MALRVTVALNGRGGAGKILKFEPHSTLDALKEECHKVVGAVVTRIFLSSGAEVEDPSVIRDMDKLIVSDGGGFITMDPDADPVASDIVSTVERPEDMTNKLVFYLNGERIEIEDADADTSLLDYVRSVGHTGTKRGCNEGGCGACSVLLSHWDPVSERIIYRSAAACLIPLPFVDHMVVTTVEGFGDQKAPHPVQSVIAKTHGTQCGFCSPGYVVNLCAMLAETEHPTAEDVEDAVNGNLCRCTGYRPILEGLKAAFATDLDIEDVGRLTREALKEDKEHGHGGCGKCADCTCGKADSKPAAEEGEGEGEGEGEDAEHKPIVAPGAVQTISVFLLQRFFLLELIGAFG
jgi:aerobic-type carbon monoxide dehydrogenase small subunit (CoxS/CutS family)